MAALPPSPSSSFGDPGWIPGYENLTPEQRQDALNKSMWMEAKLREHVQQVNDKFVRLGVRKFGDVQWILEYRNKDGQDSLVFQHRHYPEGNTWYTISAPMRIFIRSLVSGQYENLSRFSADPGFEGWIFTGEFMREKLDLLIRARIASSGLGVYSVPTTVELTPSPLWTDTNWIPGYENLTPEQRYDASTDPSGLKRSCGITCINATTSI
jgi:hypothetical protein